MRTSSVLGCEVWWRDVPIHPPTTAADRSRHAPPDALRVSLADKLDNARAIATDYRLLGEGLWSPFSVGRRDQLWYYRSLVEVIGAARPPGRLLGKLEAQVTKLESLVAAGG